MTEAKGCNKVRVVGTYHKGIKLDEKISGTDGGEE